MGRNIINDAADIQTALQALPNIGVGNVTVTGTNLVSDFAVTYGGALANTPMPPITIPRGELNSLHADNDTFDNPIIRVPQDVLTQTIVAVPGVAASALTPTPYTLQAGIAPPAVPGVVTTTVMGISQTFDGVVLPAGQPKVFDQAVPQGALYLVSDTPNTPVEVWEG